MSVFEYEKFIELGGIDLCGYMEPFLSDPSLAVPNECLQRILTELPAYDEYHLVYAMNLGAICSWGDFARHIPRFLASEHYSVVCAAANILERLPQESVTAELVELVSTVISRHPVPQFVNEMHHRMKEKLRMKKGRKGTF